MVDVLQSLIIIDVILLLSIVLLCALYILTIVVNPRFHTATNILTGNVCLTSIVCCLHWSVVNILSTFYPSVIAGSYSACIVDRCLSDCVNCLIIYSLAMITINRFLLLIYPNKPAFKRKAYSFVSSAFQWICVILLCVPQLTFAVGDCANNQSSSFWIHFYAICILVILPICINGVFNCVIFLRVRSSTRRVQALAEGNTPAPVNINHPCARDIRLLKHMLFIFVVSVAGWAPVYIVSLVKNPNIDAQWFYFLLQLLPVFSSLINVLDLFWYNHDLRQYLKERCSLGAQFVRFRVK